jgi:hypothetical protein
MTEDHPYQTSALTLTVYKADYMLDQSTQIFLSHKGADKPMVRRFFSTLDALGFHPWLDEDAMPAGTKLHRGIQEGFKKSCAAVFFITTRFVDENYIRKEIDYAVEEEREKGQRFSIITLVFADDEGKKGVVPSLLQPYVWKEPTHELDALVEIVRALPIQLGAAQWRPGF